MSTLIDVIDVDDTEVAYKTVTINDHDYQVPSAVAMAINSLIKGMDQERQEHEKEIKRLDQLTKSALKEHEVIADRIILNLNEGIIRMRGYFNAGDDSCLAYKIDETFGKADSYGNPLFLFHDEVKRRVLNALAGKTAKGSDYKEE